MNVYGLRMRLARRIAPAPIMLDTIPGDGVVILYRKEGWSWAIKATRFRLKSTQRLASLDFSDVSPIYRPHRSFTRFVGTVEL